MILRIPLRAKPTPRPRVRTLQGGYYPAAYQSYKDELEWLIKKAWRDAGGSTLTGPQQASVEFSPDSILIEITPTDTARNGMRADLDNLFKGVGDALESVGVIENDSQIHEMHCRFS